MTAWDRLLRIGADRSLMPQTELARTWPDWHAARVDQSSRWTLSRELKEIDALSDWVREEFYRVRAGGLRATATTAIAAAAAEETYRLADGVPELRNEASRLWRDHLRHVWAFVNGDEQQHYPISAAVAEYLVSPLNHVEGQDGPDDFDRPQTVAAYCAALAAITWGVDFAVTAVTQIFECLDVIHGQQVTDQRRADVQRQIEMAKANVKRVVGQLRRTGEVKLPSEIVTAMRNWAD